MSSAEMFATMLAVLVVFALGIYTGIEWEKGSELNRRLVADNTEGSTGDVD